MEHTGGNESSSPSALNSLHKNLLSLHKGSLSDLRTLNPSSSSSYGDEQTRNSISLTRRSFTKSTNEEGSKIGRPRALSTCAAVERRFVQQQRQRRGSVFSSTNVSKTDVLQLNVDKTAPYKEMVFDVTNSIAGRRRVVVYLCVTALVGLFFQILHREIDFHYNNPTSATFVHLLRAMGTISSCMLVYFLLQYYRLQWTFDTLDHAYLHSAVLWDVSRMQVFAVEAVILFIHEPPFLNIGMDISTAGSKEPIIMNNPWCLLMFLRFYLVVRLVKNFYYTGGTMILGLWHHFRFDASFVMRNVLFSHPFYVLLPSLVVMLMVSSYSYTLCEREANQDLFPDDIGTSIWFIFITMTAVGYGDITPETTCGRTVAVATSMCAIVLTAVLVATIYQNL